jgi:hypothetical protein
MRIDDHDGLGLDSKIRFNRFVASDAGRLA